MATDDEPKRIGCAMLDAADQHPDIPSLAELGDDESCPVCGAPVIFGYGLMGGGCGGYATCTECDWKAKDQDEPD